MIDNHTTGLNTFPRQDLEELLREIANTKANSVHTELNRVKYTLCRKSYESEVAPANM